LTATLHIVKNWMSKKETKMTRMGMVTLVLLGVTLMANAVVAGPLKVYILAGQSNMQGHAHRSTFDYMGKDPATASILKDMLDSKGEPRLLEAVQIAYLSEDRSGAPTEKNGPLTVGFGADDNKIGPEFTFGITMHKMLGEPILLIKTAWGGKSLHTDFRPPSASSDTKPTGAYYTRMLAHVRKVLSDPGKIHPQYNPQAGYEIAGFVWFQGWNDMVDGGIYPQRGKPGGYALYTDLLADFIRDVRRDLAAPDMRFVIGVLGVGGPTELYTSPRYVPIHQGFRDAMAAPAALPEFAGNVAVVLTETFWDQKLDEVVSKREGRTAEEEEIARGASNKGFHYLGAAKILGPIGKAFAEAMVER
jgi:hypothetical protein